mgnify:CR=1 FL=1
MKRDGAGKTDAGTRITRPLLASYAAELSAEGWPRLRLDYVTGEADVLLGPHQELWLTLDPVQAVKLGDDLHRLAADANARLRARQASIRRKPG